MARIHNQNRKSELARVLAEGGTAREWAEANKIPERTVYRWSASREVVDEVAAIRAAVLERAVGRLSKMAADAADRISQLATDASSESVRLQAARAVLHDLITVSGHTILERRMTEIERRIAEARGEWSGGMTGPPLASPSSPFPAR